MCLVVFLLKKIRLTSSSSSSTSHHHNHHYYTNVSIIIRPSPSSSPTGSLSNDDGDVNENGIKATGLDGKTTTLHVHYAFLYISLSSVHDCDVKMPYLTFCGGREHKATISFFFFCYDTVFWNSTPQKLPRFVELNEIE